MSQSPSNEALEPLSVLECTFGDMKNICPNCLLESSLRQIIWGLPIEEPDPNEYVMGGCCPPENPESWECIDCHWRGSLED